MMIKFKLQASNIQQELSHAIKGRFHKATHHSNLNLLSKTRQVSKGEQKEHQSQDLGTLGDMCQQ